MSVSPTPHLPTFFQDCLTWKYSGSLNLWPQSPLPSPHQLIIPILSCQITWIHLSSQHFKKKFGSFFHSEDTNTGWHHRFICILKKTKKNIKQTTVLEYINVHLLQQFAMKNYKNLSTSFFCFLNTQTQTPTPPQTALKCGENPSNISYIFRYVNYKRSIVCWAIRGHYKYFS